MELAGQQRAANGADRTNGAADEAQPTMAEVSRRAAANAQAAIALTQLAAQDLSEALAGAIDDTAAGDDALLQSFLTSARRVTTSAAAAGQALDDAVNAKTAVVAAAAAAATEARMTEARLTHELLHDSLTGLPNRRLLLDRLTQALARCHRTGTFVAVLFLDLDQFKSVNDRNGHAAGDQLLVGVASRLQESIRDSDTCARVGGDEFIVILEDMAEASDGALLAARLELALARGVSVRGQSMPVYASVGIAVNSPGSTPADLLAEADTAMYRVKGADPTLEKRRRADRRGAITNHDTGPGDPPHTRRRVDRL